MTGMWGFRCPPPSFQEYLDMVEDKDDNVPDTDIQYFDHLNNN